MTTESLQAEAKRARGRQAAATREGSVLPRLSHATIAFTRGSAWPTYETPAAPNEWPAAPMRERSIMPASGL